MAFALSVFGLLTKKHHFQDGLFLLSFDLSVTIGLSARYLFYSLKRCLFAEAYELFIENSSFPDTILEDKSVENFVFEVLLVLQVFFICLDHDFAFFLILLLQGENNMWCPFLSRRKGFLFSALKLSLHVVILIDEINRQFFVRIGLNTCTG